MNLKRNQLIIDLLHLFLQFIVIYMLITTILRSFFSDAAIKVLLLLPAPFLSYAIRRSMKHLWSFLLLHILLLTLYLLLADHPYFMVVYGIYLVCLGIYAFIMRQRSVGQAIGFPYPVLFLLFLYVCCYFLPMPDIQKMCFYLSLLYIMLYVLMLYLSNLSRFARNHADLQNVPFRQIRSSNRVLTIFLCGLFLFTMLLFSKVPLGAIISYLGKMLLRIIRMLLSLLPQSEAEPPQTTAAEEAQTPAYDFAQAEPSWLMELISKMMQWIAVILAVAAIVALVLYVIYRLYRYFYLKSEMTAKDEVVFLSPLTTKERSAKAGRHSHRWFFGRSNNDSIRRLFAKAVSSKAKNSGRLSRSMTPHELSEIALSTAGAVQTPAELEHKRQQLTDYYEKARYSDKQCSGEEVRKVKELLK